MLKKVVLAFILILLVSSSGVGAKNNKFGMHVAVPEDGELRQVAELVNSSGGDWGYVTVVMQEDDLNRQKWQDVFDRMRELHLIPIVRLATRPEEGGFWRCPNETDIDGWINFLNSLNWVVKNRYIVLFNEPNHGAEWGGAVDPKNYASIVEKFSKKLNEQSSDFFVMMAGIMFENQTEFFRQMHLALDGGLPELFENIDGWASHSYPNHGYVGSPTASGRNTVLNYQWELSLLRSFGVKKDLPVFITETGWPHFEGLSGQTGFYSADQVAKNFKTYFSRILPDERIVAITPFIFNYQGEPFDHFSWRKPNNGEFYPQYEMVLGISKTAGQPEQKQILKIKDLPPKKLIHNSTYKFFVDITNEGQAIWDKEESYNLKLIGAESNSFEYFFSDLRSVAPFETKRQSLSLKTGDKIANYDLRFMIYKSGEPVSNPVDWQVDVRPNIDLKFSVQPLLWWSAKGKDFKFLIYDDNEQVIFAREGLTVTDGKVILNQIDNVALDQEYRLVLVKPGSLPRQTYTTFHEPGLNRAEFKFLIPIDFNHDGKISWSDFTLPFKHILNKF